MANRRTNGQPCPKGAMCSNNESVLEKEGMNSSCVKTEILYKEIDSLTISQTGACSNTETSEILVEADEESDEPDSSAEPKARRKYCLFELTTLNTNKHIISKIKCENFRKYFRKDDEVISVNSTISFSHTELVKHFNREIEDFYKEESTLVIEVKRVESGITEFITFTSQATQYEEDGPCSKILKNFKFSITERSFEYIERIPARIIRLCCYSHLKYLKYDGKAISMDVIDGEKNLFFKFLYTEFQVGPVDGKYEYMGCIQDVSHNTFLCQCRGNKDIQFESMQPIEFAEKRVKVDKRFFFRTKSKEANDINYFQSVKSKNHYLAYNAVDGLYLKNWTAQNRSGEFEFKLFYIDS
ncbi:uncharacterized protein LOC126825390 isoform X1 [Patella vulgata]|uniref:uncharacterized protein LOC126825390 isoform X1 n=1 Tax=Patella vulgata TaxID=6465 RepID=UPI0024A9DFE2|nr:uncharacterized protein LOC126825390 isoform X1 [Patella vulgata]XP_050410998.2 uncharacterized protein LOC126825390 isoform X1 [Patella vulgata]XP_050411008.2 uncharacterized protein LOC126825390 isoform X1 [Patella vulgata]